MSTQKAQNVSAPELSRWTMAGYGVGSIGTGIFSTVPALFFLFYLTNILGVPAALAAFGAFAPKIWDMITDPFMGWISDRTKSRWGRRRPYLLAGAILTGAAFSFLFQPPGSDDVMTKFLIAVGLYTFCATSYTVFSIPYISMPAEMTQSRHARTQVVSYRIFFLLIGVTLSGVFAPKIIEQFGSGADGFAAMSVILGSIIGLTMLASFFGTASAPNVVHESASISLLTQLKTAGHNKSFLWIFFAYGVQMTAFGVNSAAIAYFMTYILEKDVAALSTVFIFFNAAAIITVPIWTFLSKRMGKLPTYILATFLYAAASITLFANSVTTPMSVFYMQIAILGLAYAGQQLLAFAILPDVIDEDDSDAETAVAGIYTGLWVAIEKTGLAAGGLVAGLALAISGLVETTEGFVEQPDSALAGIRMVFAIAPALLFFLSILAIGKLRQNP